MVEQLKELLKEISNDTEAFGLMALCYARMKAALERQGFTPDQAMQIVANQGMGIKGS